jgi:hypothetical protein
MTSVLGTPPKCQKAFSMHRMKSSIYQSHYTERHIFHRWVRAGYSVRAGAAGAGTLVPEASGSLLRRRGMSAVTDDPVPPRAGGTRCIVFP